MSTGARNVFAVVLLAATLRILTTADSQSQGLGLFRIEGQAQQHCPTDAVVWLDLKKRVDRKSTCLNSSQGYISYAVFCLTKKNKPTCSNARRPSVNEERLRSLADIVG